MKHENSKRQEGLQSIKCTSECLQTDRCHKLLSTVDLFSLSFVSSFSLSGVVDLIFDGVLRSICSAFAVLVVNVVSCL